MGGEWETPAQIFWHIGVKKKWYKLSKLGGGLGNLNKIQKNSYFFRETFPNTEYQHTLSLDDQYSIITTPKSSQNTTSNNKDKTEGHLSMQTALCTLARSPPGTTVGGW